MLQLSGDSATLDSVGWKWASCCHIVDRAWMSFDINPFLSLIMSFK
jgi:hypothetical protein